MKPPNGTASKPKRGTIRYKLALIDVPLIVAAYLLGLGVILLDPAVENVLRYFLALVMALPFIIALHLVCNLAMGAYRRDLDQSGRPGVKRVALASAIAFPIVVALVIAPRAISIVVPYAAVVLGGIGAVFAMGLVRFVSPSLSAPPSNQADNE